MTAEPSKDMQEKIGAHFSKEECQLQMRAIHSLAELKIKEPADEKTQTKKEPVQKSPHQNVCIPADSWSFKSVDGFCIPTEEMDKIPHDQQEHFLIRDLIYALSGVPSTHIKPEMTVDQIAGLNPKDIGNVRFKLSDKFSNPLRAVAQEVVPLISYYISVQSFIEESNMSPRGGRARQALVATFLEYTEKYHEHQAALETQLRAGRLSVQKLVQSLRPTLIIMEAYAKLASSVRQKQLNSAQLISLLDELYKEHKNIPNLNKELRNLIVEVSKCYMKLLQVWTQSGVVYDPQLDFYIEDTEHSKLLSNALLKPQHCCYEYWNQRYRKHFERLPRFLEPYAHWILNSGKYLNVLQQCQVKFKLLREPLEFCPDDKSFEAVLRRSYELSAGTILRFLRQEHHLMQQLCSVVTFFLMPAEQVTKNLITKSQQYLELTVECINPQILNDLLKHALMSCTEPFKQLLYCQLTNHDVPSQLAKHLQPQERESTAVSSEAGDGLTSANEEKETFILYGFEAVTLHYDVKWPVTLVLHAELMDKLQLLQRVLFFLRYVQQKLSSQCQKQSKTTRSQELCKRMLASMHNVEQYIIHDIIEPQWQAILLKLDRTQHIDVFQDNLHNFLDMCFTKALLPESSTYVSAIFTLGHVCLNYCGFLDSPAVATDYTEFKQGVSEYVEEFNSLLVSILGLLRGLVHVGSGKFCKQLLERLGGVNAELIPHSAH